MRYEHLDRVLPHYLTFFTQSPQSPAEKETQSGFFFATLCATLRALRDINSQPENMSGTEDKLRKSQKDELIEILSRPRLEESVLKEVALRSNLRKILVHYIEANKAAKERRKNAKKS